MINRTIKLILIMLIFTGFEDSNAFSKPNIIFIMADDLGYGDLGCYGQQEIKTPNIDKLASEGMRFSDCYAGSTVCAPSRSVLMTGKHTGHTTVRGNFGKGKKRVPLNEEDVTIAEVLKKAGYKTGMTGKWGLGEPGTSGIPNKQGFDEWYGYLNQRRAHSYYPTYLWHNENKVMLEGNDQNKNTQYSHDLFAKFALDFIKKNKSETFFLYLPYTIPHDKYEIPNTDPYANKPWKKDEKIHAAMITRMDNDIGEMMTLLKTLEIDKNTIVFFCSDNGAAKRWENRFNSSGVLRGAKRDMYEGGLRTPMIVRWPEKIKPGSENDLVWYFPDVLPTLADLAKVKSPTGIDGISVLATLLGEKQKLENRFLYWEFFERGYQQAARWKNWKAVRLKPGAPLELYDLSKALDEKNNVAKQFPEIIEKFEDYLKSARTKSKDWPLKK